MVIEVPHLKDVPTDVTPNLQERLNCVTDVLSRVSKLVCEDLDKAVSSAVGQDKDGNPSVRGQGAEGVVLLTVGLCSNVLRLFSAPRLPSRQEAHPGCGTQSCGAVPPQRQGGSQCLYVSYTAARGVKLKYTMSRCHGPTWIFTEKFSSRYRRKPLYMDPNEFCFGLNMKQAELNTIQ